MNKELFSKSSIIINFIYSNMLFYKNIIININDLKKLFKSILDSTYFFFNKSILININLKEFLHIKLKEFNKFENYKDIILFKSFKDFHLNFKFNNEFLINKIIEIERLQDYFFIISNNNLKLN